MFIHGLGSNLDTTWTATNEDTARLVHWVTDFLLAGLSRDIAQKTRIYFFNYDTNWRRDALEARLNHISEKLLLSLQDLVRQNATVSIPFPVSP